MSSSIHGTTKVCIPSICSSLTCFVKITHVKKPLHDPCCSMMATEWYLDHLAHLVEVPLKLPQLWSLLVPPCAERFQRGLVTPASHVDVIKQLIRKAGFTNKSVQCDIADVKKSTACLCQGRRPKFFHWCHVKTISPYKATIQQIAQFYHMYINLNLTIPLILGYKSALNSFGTMWRTIHHFSTSSLDIMQHKVCRLQNFLEKYEVMHKQRSITYMVRQRVKLVHEPRRWRCLMHKRTRTHTQLHDLANHQCKTIYQTVSINIYNLPFLSKTHYDNTFQPDISHWFRTAGRNVSKIIKMFGYQ